MRTTASGIDFFIRAAGVVALVLVALVFRQCVAPTMAADASGAFARSGPNGQAADAASPMSYCTLEDLTGAYGEKRVAQLTGDPNGTTVDADTAEASIANAAREIETAVIAQYGESLAEAGIAYLKQLNVEGAFLALQAKTAGGLGDRDATGRLDLKRWDERVDAIASGERRLRPEPDEDEDGVQDTTTTFTSKPRLFGRCGPGTEAAA